MVNIDWGNAENSLLVWRVQRNWHTNESDEAWKIILHTLAQSKPISLMIDLRQCLAPIKFMRHLQAQMDAQLPDNLPMIVVITLPEFLDSLSKANRNTRQCRVEIVASVDAAYSLVDLNDAAV